MSPETPSGMRRYPRISLPKGMFAAWYGGGDQQVSRVETLGMGRAVPRLIPCNVGRYDPETGLGSTRRRRSGRRRCARLLARRRYWRGIYPPGSSGPSSAGSIAQAVVAVTRVFRGLGSRTRSLSGPLSPRGPQPVLGRYASTLLGPMVRRSQRQRYAGCSTRVLAFAETSHFNFTSLACSQLAQRQRRSASEGLSNHF